MEIDLAKIAKNAAPTIKRLGLDVHTMAYFLIQYHLKELATEDYREFAMWDISENTLTQDLVTQIKSEMRK